MFGGIGIPRLSPANRNGPPQSEPSTSKGTSAPQQRSETIGKNSRKTNSALIRQIFHRLRRQTMDALQPQPSTSSGATTNGISNSSNQSEVGAPAFLNVAHMVRQSSDTIHNRSGRRLLTRSPAFDEYQTMANGQGPDDAPRPATSQCIADDEMPNCSPHLRRPTRLTCRVTVVGQQQPQVHMNQGGDAAGYIQLNQYKLMEEIGQGSYGIVKLAYNEQDKNLYAMKVLDKLKLVKNFACFRPPPLRKKTAVPSVDGQLAIHRNPLQLVQREIAILKKLAHPNVVTLVEVLDDPSDNFLYMVFEYVERRSLLELPTENPLDEHTAWRYFRDTLKGLEYLHFQKIVHRDLKPSNLLLSDSETVKIADFGVSCEFEGIDAFLTGTAGTPAFMAPEALTGIQCKENSNQFYSGRAQDIWSLGITLYALVFGNVPFWDPYVIALHKKIKTEPLYFPESIMVSDLLKSLITGMLKKDPGLRLLLQEIKEHPWVTRNGKMPMPNETENCTLVTVTDEEIQNCVRVIPRLDTLILVKAMGRKKHFGNPFRSSCEEAALIGQGMRSRRKSSSLREHKHTPPTSPRQQHNQQDDGITNGPTVSYHQQQMPQSARPAGPCSDREIVHQLNDQFNAMAVSLGGVRHIAVTNGTVATGTGGGAVGNTTKQQQRVTATVTPKKLVSK